jgi:hypothetical protein
VEKIGCELAIGDKWTYLTQKLTISAEVASGVGPVATKKKAGQTSFVIRPSSACDVEDSSEPRSVVRERRMCPRCKAPAGRWCRDNWNSVATHPKRSKEAIARAVLCYAKRIAPGIAKGLIECIGWVDASGLIFDGSDLLLAEPPALALSTAQQGPASLPAAFVPSLWRVLRS